jgi:hypothetical protein
MQMKIVLLAPWLMLLTIGVSAQTVTGSGISGTIPVFTGSSTVGNSVITQSSGNVLNVAGSIVRSGFLSTTASGAPSLFNTVSPFINTSFSANGWDAITPQVTNPSASGQSGFIAYTAAPVVTATDGTTRVVTGGSFAPSLIASGGSSGNSVLGISADGFIGSSAATATYDSLYGANLAAGVGPNVPAATIIGQAIVAKLSPLVQGGSVGAVRALQVEPSFGSTGGPANLKVPTYYAIELGPPVLANGATITSNYGIFQEDTAAKNFFAGQIGIGTTTPGATLEVDGSIKLTSGSTGGITFQDGSTQSTAFIPANCGADYAESVGVSGDRAQYGPGDILVIDPAAPGKFLRSNEAYSTLVAGIYSTQPGFVGRLHPADAATNATEVPMAMVGRVPTKVSAENGAIHVGDLLVSSSTLGYAMKGTDRSRMLGAVVGKAMGSLDSGTGVIEVLVTLQ